LLPDGNEWTEISSHDCGYAALYNVFRRIHPLLMDDPPRSVPPRYRTSEAIGEYINRWRDFLLQENVIGRVWTPMAYTRRIILNISLILIKTMTMMIMK
jgi:hypothetical protein